MEGDGTGFECGDFPVACWIFPWTCPADGRRHTSLGLVGKTSLVKLDLVKAIELEEEEFIGSQDDIAQDTNIKERYNLGFARR